ncbi:TadE/TadG family type IV pilus assembly protein [Litorivivens sp.]|uniref:TadE/TadG family type IV pilus assembly protein n=1 Tax=Litorivivens sp. TaxID=2020868 RepID=UPI0035627A42
MTRFRKHTQRGASAIEFSLIFPVFMALIYAIVTYSMVFMLIQSFTYASEDALRAAIAVDCQGLTTQQCIDDRITPAVRTQVVSTLDWLPASVKSEVLGASGEKVVVNCVSDTCTVEVRYNNYDSNPLIPAITLPTIGTIPRIPQHLVGRASLRV